MAYKGLYVIYVDDRVGSRELLPLFHKGAATLTHLEYADFMLIGHGDGEDIAIGIERKRIGDFVNSMCSGRFSGRQLIGMMNSYHYLYLIIEGMFRANPQTGLLEVWRRGGWQEYTAGKRRFMARDIWTFMNTIQVVCGFHCYHTSRDTDTAHYIMALHHWWNKEYAEHRGHLQPHNGRVVELTKQTLVRKVASCLAGVGWEKSKAIDQRFKTVEELVRATPEELMEIEGIGKGLSGSIITQLRGGV
jgi:ERCC4-type nuclease